MSENQTSGNFFMAGTTGSDNYAVAVVTPLGRVGVRDLSAGTFRVRVEPSSDAAAKRLSKSFPKTSWKQPGDDNQNRFSTVVSGGEAALAAVAERCANALLAPVSRDVEWNTQSDASAVVKAVAERTSGIWLVRLLELPGAFGATRWSTQTLWRKAQSALGLEIDDTLQSVAAVCKNIRFPGDLDPWSMPFMGKRRLDCNCRAGEVLQLSAKCQGS